VVTEENKEEFAREIIQTKSVVKEELETKKGKMIKAWVKFPLVPDHLRIRAQWYLDPVRKQAKRFGISVPVALAVMHTESYFNPKAMSPVPAYGLMQLVPRAGALDAYRYVYKVEKIVSADYLYDPVNNIELGCGSLLCGCRLQHGAGKFEPDPLWEEVSQVRG
jgi:membrane-bound lytic murein transglycosylase C